MDSADYAFPLVRRLSSANRGGGFRSAALFHDSITCVKTK